MSPNAGQIFFSITGCREPKKVEKHCPNVTEWLISKNKQQKVDFKQSLLGEASPQDDRGQKI